MESYSRRTGARLALAIAEPNTGDFLVKLKKQRKRALEEVTDGTAQRRSRAREPVDRRRVPAHSGGPDRRPGLVAAADRDQDLQRRRGRLQRGGEADRRVAAQGQGRGGHRQPDHRDRPVGQLPRGPGEGAAGRLRREGRGRSAGRDAGRRSGVGHDPRRPPDRHPRALPGPVPVVVGPAEGPAAHLAHRADGADVEHRRRRDRAGNHGDPPREPAQSLLGDGAPGEARPGFGHGRDPAPPAQGGAAAAGHRHRVRRAVPDAARVVPGADAGAAAVDPADLHHSGVRVPLLLAPDRDSGGDHPVRLRRAGWRCGSPGRR